MKTATQNLDIFIAYFRRNPMRLPRRSSLSRAEQGNQILAWSVLSLGTTTLPSLTLAVPVQRLLGFSEVLQALRHLKPTNIIQQLLTSVPSSLLILHCGHAGGGSTPMQASWSGLKAPRIQITLLHQTFF